VTPRREVRGATIVGTGMYVPERVLSNRDLERMVDTSDEWIRERSGILERRISAPEQASSDLSLIAARRALEMAGIEPDALDQIVLATTTPDRFLPSCACTLQQKLGAHRAAAYDLFAACTGFVYGMSLVRGLIGAGVADTVLVVGVEQLSRIVDYTDRNTCVLFGDAAGAAVFRPCEPEAGVLSVHIQSDGDLGEVLVIPAGGSRLPASEETVRAKQHFIQMQGKKLFPFAVRSMEDSLRRSLAEAGLAPEDLEVVISHQANLRIIDAVRERLGVAPEKMLINIERYGNTSSASIPVLLDEAVRAGRIGAGDAVGFCAFGGGATWGASVMRWTMARVIPAAPAAEAGAKPAARAPATGLGRTGPLAEAGKRP
jgi:3-oxoacyl-[acyl-carrier-protein] synthase III